MPVYLIPVIIRRLEFALVHPNAPQRQGYRLFFTRGPDGHLIVPTVHKYYVWTTIGHVGVLLGTERRRWNKRRVLELVPWLFLTQAVIFSRSLQDALLKFSQFEGLSTGSGSVEMQALRIDRDEPILELPACEYMVRPPMMDYLDCELHEPTHSVGLPTCFLFNPFVTAPKGCPIKTHILAPLESTRRIGYEGKSMRVAGPTFH